MKRITFNQKLHLLIITAHVSAMYAVFFNFSWSGLLIAYLGWFLFKMIGTEIGAHRYFTHKSFETSDIKKKLLLFLHFWAGDGSLLAFIGVHRTHHGYCDTDKDPHSPQYKSWLAITYWTSPINLQLKFIKDWASDPWIKFSHYHYFKIHFLVFLIFLIAGGIDLYGYLIGLPMVLCLYTNTIINILCHSSPLGYRNFHTPDQSNNSKIIMWLMYGCGLHNNHHANASSYTLKVRPDEIDPLGFIINKFFKSTCEK